MTSNLGWKLTVYSATATIDMTKPILDAASGGFFDTHTVQEILTKHALPENYEEQYLVISNKKNPYWRTVSLRLGWFFSIDLNSSSISRPKNDIVYYVNSYVNLNYWVLCYFQLSALKRSGLLSDKNTMLNIVFAGNKKSQSIFTKKVKKIFTEYQNVTISYTTGNEYEYPGIYKVKMLAKDNPDGNILYFHPKGLSHLNLKWLRTHRLRIEKRLFKHVVIEWRENLEWLSHIPSVNKLGFQIGGRGWAWYNFWWARCSHINQLEDPIKTQKRYYYESWLAKKADGEPDIGDCISIFSILDLGVPNLGYIYTPNSYENKLAFYPTLHYWIERFKIFLRSTTDKQRGLNKRAGTR